MPPTSSLATRAGCVLDTLLDRAVVPGYSRIGLAVRSRLPGWPADPGRSSLRGQQVLVTGATSGLGTATAEGAALLGARIHLAVRDLTRGERTAAEIRDAVPGAEVVVWRCDVADLDDVRRFAAKFADTEDRLDVVVHNAGLMPPERTESRQGHEMTMAVHLLGPTLMTELLLPVLRGHDARVVMVTSGGMYAQEMREDDPEYHRGSYSPTTAYARSKRAQVELLGLMQRRWGQAGVTVHATHPGWADTPGVADSMPGFRRLTGPILRDAAGGADTTVWLAAVTPAPEGGSLWHDRRARPTHLLPRTRTTPQRRTRMWDWTLSALGLRGLTAVGGSDS